VGDRIEATLLRPDAPSWSDDVDGLREELGAPNNVYLIPPHFLKATLPKIGGQIATFSRAGKRVGGGFLFPRGDGQDGSGYTLRLHWKDRSAVSESDAEAAAASLPEAIRLAGVTAYDPTAPLAMSGSTVFEDGDLTIEVPDERGAEEIRWLQDEIWKPEPDYLYPVDIHSPAFRPGTSLVARVKGEPVAFLFGFYKLGGPKLPERLTEAYRTDLRLESQLMGVLPAHRSRGLGFLLKKTQALLARRDGVDVVNWTVDPLQYGNAVLNFTKLRGVAFDHYPDYYAFRNALNQVAASRFNVTWLVWSPHVQAALETGGGGRPIDLADRPRVRRVNQGPGFLILSADDPEIAVEVPADWTSVQGTSAALAQAWRETTDTLLQQYVGADEGKYAVTDAARDGDRRYLLAKRVTPSLLAAYL
jgi:predicted GNAT superfamily acetyltransferase